MGRLVENCRNMNRGHITLPQCSETGKGLENEIPNAIAMLTKGGHFIIPGANLE